VELHVRAYDHPDSTRLIEELQNEYRVRYGDIDHTPVDPAEFAPPIGLFLVGYLDGEPVACGGWRERAGVDDADPPLVASAVEIKRMYVVPKARGRGLSRLLLAELERTAREAGYPWVVLESGVNQPEALGLYRSSGYQRIPSFGIHRHHPGNRCFGKPLVGDVDGAPAGVAEVDGAPRGAAGANGAPADARHPDRSQA